MESRNQFKMTDKIIEKIVCWDFDGTINNLHLLVHDDENFSESSIDGFDQKGIFFYCAPNSPRQSSTLINNVALFRLTLWSLENNGILSLIASQRAVYGYASEELIKILDQLIDQKELSLPTEQIHHLIDNEIHEQDEETRTFFHEKLNAPQSLNSKDKEKILDLKNKLTTHAKEESSPRLEMYEALNEAFGDKRNYLLQNLASEVGKKIALEDGSNATGHTKSMYIHKVVEILKGSIPEYLQQSLTDIKKLRDTLPHAASENEKTQIKKQIANIRQELSAHFVLVDDNSQYSDFDGSFVHSPRNKDNELQDNLYLAEVLIKMVPPENLINDLNAYADVNTATQMICLLLYSLDKQIDALQIHMESRLLKNKFITLVYGLTKPMQDTKYLLFMEKILDFCKKQKLNQLDQTIQFELILRTLKYLNAEIKNTGSIEEAITLNKTFLSMLEKYLHLAENEAFIKELAKRYQSKTFENLNIETQSNFILTLIAAYAGLNLPDKQSHFKDFICDILGTTKDNKFILRIMDELKKEPYKFIYTENTVLDKLSKMTSTIIQITETAQHQLRVNIEIESREADEEEKKFLEIFNTRTGQLVKKLSGLSFFGRNRSASHPSESPSPRSPSPCLSPKQHHYSPRFTISTSAGSPLSSSSTIPPSSILSPRSWASSSPTTSPYSSHSPSPYSSSNALSLLSFLNLNSQSSPTSPTSQSNPTISLSGPSAAQTDETRKYQSGPS